jgi:hypothetical protein
MLSPTNPLLLIVTYLLMLAGLAGTVLPALPGIILTGVIPLLFGALTSFESLRLSTALWLLGAALVAWLLSFWASARGAKAYGGSNAAKVGAFVGMWVGLASLWIWGMLVGTFLGAFIGELVTGARPRAAGGAAWGAVLGALGGTFLQCLVALAIIIAFTISFFA